MKRKLGLLVKAGSNTSYSLALKGEARKGRAFSQKVRRAEISTRLLRSASGNKLHILVAGLGHIAILVTTHVAIFVTAHVAAHVAIAAHGTARVAVAAHGTAACIATAARTT
jgi:hypothetical protein